ncbi:hypothetical protein ABIA22_000369 [Sinorhizobium fredii]|uniref:hypothetical protein n=1 Tax=Rhizobium fredii TaxID=380 RepID=UPI0035196419
MMHPFALLIACPVCGAAMTGGARTSMGYWRKEFECNAAFVLYDSGRVEVPAACPEPSNGAAGTLEREMVSFAGASAFAEASSNGGA